MRPELKIARQNTGKFFASLDTNQRAQMVNSVMLSGIELANVARSDFESGQDVGVRKGLLRASTIAFPPKVTRENVRVGVGVLRRAFYAGIIARGVKHSWEISPRQRFSSRAGRANHPNFSAKKALRTPFGPKAHVTHPALRRRPFLNDALKAYRPQFRARVFDGAKAAIAATGGR